MSWTEAPRMQMARDGRMRLTHGPIDVIVTADGPARAVARALGRARDGFAPLLTGLCAELPRLRQADGLAPTGPVAQRMHRAAARFAPAFATPMAAVAGAVSDHLLAEMLVPGHALTRAHVNNGGDIALYTRSAPLRLAICDVPETRAPGARALIGPRDGIGGVATSGWRGRSHSMGIADAVTVLARDAALADVAATLIANAVDLPGHPAIMRAPANTLSPDSDLGPRPVTTDVGPLAPPEIAAALVAARALAQDYISRGLIRAACVALAGTRIALGQHIETKELQNA